MDRGPTLPRPGVEFDRRAHHRATRRGLTEQAARGARPAGRQDPPPRGRAPRGAGPTGPASREAGVARRGARDRRRARTKTDTGGRV